MSKELIIQEAVKNGDWMTLFFVGSFRSCTSGAKARYRMATMYKNSGKFSLAESRLICDGMPFSRHMSKVSCIIDKHGDVVFGRYCKKCKTARPKGYSSCPVCGSTLHTP